MMKKFWLIVAIGFLFIAPTLAEAQADRILDRVLERVESPIRSRDLKVTKLEISPDPIRQGQRVSFRATILNNSRNSGRVTLAVRDSDDIITEARDIRVRPGENLVTFPETLHRFSRSDHCFTVEANIERTRSPIDLATQFCARRTQSGWSMSERGVGPLYVEDLEMVPDPAVPGQEIGFRLKLRNDGRPILGHIQIQDRDQIVTRVENVRIPRGLTDFTFNPGRYAFQRFDTCFTVSVNIEQTPYPVDAAKKYCAFPVGWTLRPAGRPQR